MTDLVSQNIETQTVISHEEIIQVTQEAQEQVVIDNQITRQVEQETQEQTVVSVEITTQVEQETQEQLTLGTPGPRGHIGPAGATTLSCIAGQVLSGHRIVTYDAMSAVVYASSAELTARTVLGMTLGAALLGDVVNVQTYGEIVEPSWTWISLEPIYLGIDGTISQTAPTTGYCVRLGFALDAHTLMLTIEPALKLC